MATDQDREYRRRLYRQNPEAARIRKWRWKYGITPADVETKWAQQGGRCAICQIPLDKTTAQIDHSHETGKFRGLLCKPCNLGLGLFNDNLLALLSAVNYLWEDTDG